MNTSRPKLADIALAVENYDGEDQDTFLKGLTSEDPYVVWYAIKGCGLKRVTEAIPKLIQTLEEPCEPLGSDKNTDLRRIAAWSLAKIGFEGLLPYLPRIQKDANSLLREGLADTLGMTGDRRAVPYLDQLMEDEDYPVRLWAALSLAKLGDVSIPVIQKHLTDSPDLKTAVYLLDSLKKIGSPEAKNLAKVYLSRTPFPELNGFWETAPVASLPDERS
jgi:HEAT repeat protein